MAETKEYVIRTEGLPNSYGLGEVIVPGVALFRKGDYHLTKEELERKLGSMKKVVVHRD